MARAVELLRSSWPDFSKQTLSAYLNWLDEVLYPQMDFYTDVITPTALNNGRKRDRAGAC
jgi:hypothetical protein